ncbi:circularly permuted type 2 ATP-grasp protein [Ottowia sp.]|jgi:uncharacterized circularly permuted ATP-grasp superfamily protein/uncharacterized alpha-E superfamily protein|uniref:circularly permuted type 2 ATP-grasp protein n=2 Tax=Ottowia sp. TaxID=1898956 RepID=UPI0025CCAF21|nr:circularly permuted type 2 ATP-grasp protein [Ottowia sp.]MBK6613182.1 circularly permuted type 2 ATP-grasp protein [Ottowia sp.]MBK6747708.1 circularly permuted type 2 ATP-grasp protein [Ottowia sp.]
MRHNTGAMTSPTERPPLPPRSPALALPRADGGHYDELHGLGGDAPAQARGLGPAWSRFFEQMGPASAGELNRRAERMARQLRDDGVSYNVYADEHGQQRPWALDLFPLLVTSDDWARIETGILQRVRVLEAVAADVYGPCRLVREGLLPPALVQGHPDYVPAMHGVRPAGGQHLHIVAFDLARGPGGHWWVVGQRTQAPSGLGYLLENRFAVTTQFPQAFEALHTRRLADSYRALLASLKHLAPGGEEPHLALLTPGPYNETYFEQSYLARYLGVTLVEGSDLTVRGERLYLKTLHGLKPVHGLIKRVDDTWLDPLEMRADSRLGVPGLMQAVRAGNVLMANAIGSGFLESSAMLGFLPALGRHLLDEELALPALHTWWCGEPAAMGEILPHLAHSVIKPTYPWSLERGTFDVGVGPLLNAERLGEWQARIRRAPDEHTVQAYLPTSQMPTWRPTGASDERGIVPSSVILRVFALSDAAGAGPGTWRVLPGGMARLVGVDAGIASMQRGGSSADAWVVDEHAGPGEGLESGLGSFIPPVAVAPTSRPERLVTSRAAENLFWLGRYTERAENAARLARIILEALHGEEEPSHAMLMWLGQMAESTGLVSTADPSPLQWRERFERALVQHLGNPEGDDTYSVAYSLHWLRGAGAALRERLSTEHWNFIKQAEEQFLADWAEIQRFDPPSAADTLAALARLSKNLAAITGAQNDRMWRDDGWRLLSIGRQLERLTFLAEALSRGFYTNAVHDAAGFGVVLQLFDSTISFHARYQRSRDIAALIEHVVLNLQNTRSIDWVVQTASGRLARLHEREAAGVEDLSRRLPMPDIDQLAPLCVANEIGDFTHLQDLLAEWDAQAQRLSDDIALRYFSHTDDARRSVGA